MGEVIEVNFNTKKKVQKYITSKFVCAYCSTTVKTDSRNKVNPSYIPLVGIRNSCLCKECSIDLANVVISEGWINDKSN